MGTRAKKKTNSIPSLREIEKQVGKLRKDLGKTVDRVSREAARYIPKSSRRQLEEIVEQVGDLRDSVTKSVTKTVKGVRVDVEDTVGDLRGTVEKRVKALRKDASETSTKALERLEKETRRQVERFLVAIGLPARGEVDGIKRRVGALERKVEELVELTARRRSKESEAA
jgi:hypothetical protein